MLRRNALFLGILSFAAVTRFLLLFVSQSHVHSDEAIIGLMGKHILEGRYLPFYMYGQAYNAGAAWEAYLATIPFAIFGVGVFPLKPASCACRWLVWCSSTKWRVACTVSRLPLWLRWRLHCLLRCSNGTSRSGATLSISCPFRLRSSCLTGSTRRRVYEHVRAFSSVWWRV